MTPVPAHLVFPLTVEAGAGQKGERVSEMVERVAAAIDPEAFADWAVDRKIAAGKLTEEDAEPVLREKWLRQTIARDRATAAIPAMQEPTREMLKALLRHRGYEPSANEATLDRLGQLDVATIGAFVAAYRAMINAALQGR